jgi:hypothetical protein
MPVMGALSHILKSIQLSATTNKCRAVGSTWNIHYQYRPQGIFHVVTRRVFSPYDATAPGDASCARGMKEDLFYILWPTAGEV